MYETTINFTLTIQEGEGVNIVHAKFPNPNSVTGHSDYRMFMTTDEITQFNSKASLIVYVVTNGTRIA
jgi:hypothetical protein